LALIRPLQNALADVDPTLPLRNPRSLQAIVDERTAARRLPALLMTTFGGLALLLASVGIYAMFASVAAARRREFGVRVALGSTRSELARLLIRQGTAWLVAGLLAGGVGIVLVVPLLQDLLFGVQPFDSVALVMASVSLITASTIALLAPVLRAARVDAVQVLRGE
jgi:putative ABC transport system permease protein